jgi:hypothetical protein
MSNNIFKTDPKDPDSRLTQRIATKDVDSTIEFIEKITGLDFTSEKDDEGKSAARLGSTGRKEKADGTFEENSSGDLDLSVDLNKVSKEQVTAKLTAWCKSQNIPEEEIMNVGRKKTDGWIKDAGDQIHFRTPINGSKENGFVQTDFMFSKNVNFQRGSMIGGSGQYRGEHRHIVLSSIARARGIKYSPKFGLVDPETDEPLPNGDDWNSIAKQLLGQSATVADVKSVDAIINYIKKLPNYEELISAARETLGRYDIELPKKEAIESFQPGSIGWMRSMIDIIK